MKNKNKGIKFDPKKTNLRLGNWDDKIQLDDLTIEDCEKLYQSGYEVIIDNGRVVDLRKFK